MDEGLAIETLIVTRTGREVRVRYLEQDDGDLLMDLFFRLSPQARFQRFHVPVDGLTRQEVEEQLPQYTNVDRENHVALLALVEDDGEEIAIGVARFKRQPGADEAEAAVVVCDDWQRQGVGTELLRRLAHVARSVGIRRFVGWIQADNRSTLRLISKLGLRAEHRVEYGEHRVLVHLL